MVLPDVYLKKSNRSLYRVFSLRDILLANLNGIRHYWNE